MTWTIYSEMCNIDKGCENLFCVHQSLVSYRLTSSQLWHNNFCHECVQLNARGPKAKFVCNWLPERRFPYSVAVRILSAQEREGTRSIRSGHWSHNWPGMPKLPRSHSDGIGRNCRLLAYIFNQKFAFFPTPAATWQYGIHTTFQSNAWDIIEVRSNITKQLQTSL